MSAVSASPLRLVAVSGEPFLPSCTDALNRAIVHELADQTDVEAQFLGLDPIMRALGMARSRSASPWWVRDQLATLETADVLLLASPVFRGSSPARFRYLLDHLDAVELIDTPILLAGTGSRTQLAPGSSDPLGTLLIRAQKITHCLRVDSADHELTPQGLSSPDLRARIQLTIENLKPLLGARSRWRKSA